VAEIRHPLFPVRAQHNPSSAKNRQSGTVSVPAGVLADELEA
jgi:hypothetical protein